MEENFDSILERESLERERECQPGEFSLCWEGALVCVLQYT